MGWTTTYDRVDNPKEFLDQELFGPHTTLVASAKVGSTYYAACRIPDGTVFALVVLTHKERNGALSYKDMEETEGPHAYTCPARILNRLTPTTSEYANKWRALCREEIAKRHNAPKLTHGDTVKFTVPIRFVDGTTQDTFTVWKKGSAVRFNANGYTYIIGNWRKREFQKIA